MLAGTACLTDRQQFALWTLSNSSSLAWLQLGHGDRHCCRHESAWFLMAAIAGARDGPRGERRDQGQHLA